MNDSLPGSDADATDFDPKRFLANLTRGPGVYRMLDGSGTVIYVGKARNLRSRVSSYFQKTPATHKVRVMMRHVTGVDVTITGTETEALILEDSLIKSLKPRYNVLLRDDKSYPFIHVSTVDAYPRVSFYRGSRRGAGRFFGPYPSAHSVRDTVNHLQKLFLLRPCENTFFANRSRPCLQYQIKRCSAPCVGLISPQDYARDVAHAVMFLEGKNEQVSADLVARMEAAAKRLEFEKAAQYRDQIARLATVQETQSVITAERLTDFDVIATAGNGRVHCIAVIVIRAGRILGSRSFFPKNAAEAETEEVLSAFLAQYYLARGAPREIIIDRAIADAALLQAALGDRAGHKVAIKHRVRGDRARWRRMAQTNADQALGMRLTSNQNVARQLESLREDLELDETPARVECFDISHTSGEATVASCVVFDQEGPRKSDYRRFNIKGVAAGDDYAAMKQALKRRYTRVRKGEVPMPDLLIVDGGKAQVKAATEVLADLQMTNLEVLGVAKGTTRKPGMEQLFLLGSTRPISLSPDAPSLHWLQHIRDEAHRFAITGHRQRRGKKRTASVLEEIHGLGPRRRRDLLHHFGGLQGIKRAGVEDLVKVNGINEKLARAIYETFHMLG